MDKLSAEQKRKMENWKGDYDGYKYFSGSIMKCFRFQANI